MFDVFINSWKTKEIRKKLLYILLIIAVYRLGCHIGLPGIDAAALRGSQDQSLFALITGGGQGTIFSMGIGPYITSSIIMQLLAVAIPYLENLQKEGEEGRKRISQITRFVSLGLATFQAIATVFTLRTYFTNQNFFTYLVAVVTLVTGTMFIMWISELLTERGVGNGSSFIISANILASIPQVVTTMYSIVFTYGWLAAIGVLLLLVLFVVLIAFVIRVQDGERKIPVQYSKKMVGRSQVGGQSSYIPIKVNIAGVMSIIFALSLLQFPAQIYTFWQNDILARVVEFLDLQHPVGAILYIFLIFCFTFFYTSFAINPVEMAENLKKNSGLIPGIRPGKPTSDHIQRTIDRLSWIGAIFYALIAMAPVVMQWILTAITGQTINVGFGGTTLLIVTGVALELVKQLESQLLMRHHTGFLGKR